MTPKLRLKDEERKTLLSCIRKFFFPGMCCIIKSTHIMLEPNTQAIVQLENRPSSLCSNTLPTPLTQVMIHPRVSLSRPIFAAFPAATRQESQQASRKERYIYSTVRKEKCGGCRLKVEAEEQRLNERMEERFRRGLLMKFDDQSKKHASKVLKMIDACLGTIGSR